MTKVVLLQAIAVSQRIRKTRPIRFRASGDIMEYIELQPDWELFEIYAYEGITGTSAEKRAASRSTGKAVGCGIGRMIRDEQKIEILKQYLISLRIGREQRIEEKAICSHRSSALFWSN